MTVKPSPYLLMLLLLPGAGFSGTSAEHAETPGPVPVCSLFAAPQKYSRNEVWVTGRLDFAPPDVGLVIGGNCSRVADLTWDEHSAFSHSLGRKALDLAQTELFIDFGRLHQAGEVTVTLRGRFSKTQSGRFVVSVTEVSKISISFLEAVTPRGPDLRDK